MPVCRYGKIEVDMVQITQGEQKPITFTITEDGLAMDVTGASLTWTVEECPGTTLLAKDDTKFDKTDAATGIIILPILIADVPTTVAPGVYLSELKMVLSGGNVIKSKVEVQIIRGIN